MANHIDKNTKRVAPVILRSVLAGTVGGIAYGIIGMAAQYMWRGQDYLNNAGIATIANFQSIALAFLTLLLTAMLSITLSYKWIKDWKASFVPCAAAGIILVVAGSFSNTIVWMIQLSPLSGADYPFYDSFAKDPAGFLIHFYVSMGPILLIAILAGMAIAGIVGLAYAFFTVRPNSEEENSKTIRRADSMAIIVIVLAIIAMIAIPPYVSSMALSMGWVDGSWSDYMNSASVTRTGSDTITIKYTGNPSLRLNSDMPFIIMVNNKNATNMDAIKQSGLAASISPPGGLKNVKGAYVNLTGNDIRAQDTGHGMYGTHVVISYVSPEGNPAQVIVDSVV